MCIYCLFSRDELLWVVKLSIRPSSYLVNYSGLKIEQHRTRHMFSCARFGEKGVERIVTSDRFVRRHLAVGLGVKTNAHKTLLTDCIIREKSEQSSKIAPEFRVRGSIAP